MFPGTPHGCHMYPLRLDRERSDRDREAIFQALGVENIGTGIHLTALRLHGYHAKTFGYRRGQFLVGEFIGDRTVSLPLSAKASEEDGEDVIVLVRRPPEL